MKLLRLLNLFITMELLILLNNINVISTPLVEARSTLPKPSARAFESTSFYLPLCVIFDVGCLSDQICEL